MHFYDNSINIHFVTSIKENMILFLNSRKSTMLGFNLRMPDSTNLPDVRTNLPD